ncbi:MAG: DUF488 family protein [Proteobacteria bacterium]|nr:DUF488 family protein [Pseudomonadota bacterium]
MVKIKRIYEPVSADDGCRVFVDRLWPRGLRKNQVLFDVWLKEIAPSPELRREFGHKPEKWKQFVIAYKKELKGETPHAKILELAKKARRLKVTLLYAARDPQHNHAVVLQSVIHNLIS